jgi:hypothetical protein
VPIRFQVDGDFYDHPKTIGMSDGATALWVRAGSYSAAKLSDGFVAEAALSLLSRCPEEAASELVERGLWRRVKGGFRFHQWDRRNLLRARVEAEREADRLRKRKGQPESGRCLCLCLCLSLCLGLDAASRRPKSPRHAAPSISTNDGRRRVVHALTHGKSTKRGPPRNAPDSTLHPSVESTAANSPPTAHCAEPRS